MLIHVAAKIPTHPQKAIAKQRFSGDMSRAVLQSLHPRYWAFQNT